MSKRKSESISSNELDDISSKDTSGTSSSVFDSNIDERKDHISAYRDKVVTKLRSAIIRLLSTDGLADDEVSEALRGSPLLLKYVLRHMRSGALGTSSDHKRRKVASYLTDGEYRRTLCPKCTRVIYEGIDELVRCSSARCVEHIEVCQDCMRRSGATSHLTYICPVCENKIRKSWEEVQSDEETINE